jgi:hypothetical protein
VELIDEATATIVDLTFTANRFEWGRSIILVNIVRVQLIADRRDCPRQ